MANQETKYIDGFVLVIPKANVEAYKKMAQEGAEIWMKHGALAFRECMLEDTIPPMVTFPFPMLTKAGPDDTVWFSYIEYRSRAHRDEVSGKVMAEMQSKYSEETEMPFEMDRMSFGGFDVVVGAS